MGHDWVLAGSYGDENRYVCTNPDCRVAGHSSGAYWPPLRLGHFIMPEWRTCEGAKQARLEHYLEKLTAELTKYGVID